MIVPKYLIEYDKCIIHTLTSTQKERIRQNNNRLYCFLIQMYLLNRETGEHSAYKRKKKGWNS
jgi:hypothetical protein